MQYKTIQSLWQNIWQFLLELNMHLLFEPAIPLLGIYSRRMKICVPKKIDLNYVKKYTCINSHKNVWKAIHQNVNIASEICEYGWFLFFSVRLSLFSKCLPLMNNFYMMRRRRTRKKNINPVSYLWLVKLWAILIFFSNFL